MGKFMYLIGRTFFRIYFKLFHNWKISGKNNRPEGGSLIVVANHISNLDPPIVGSVLNRQVFFMAKQELFTNKFFGWVLKKIGVFPVNRGKPDRNALKRALKILEEDKILGLFPEGTRHKPGNPGKAQGGAIMLALRSKSPILPVGIKDVNKNERTKISIGQPFTLNQYYDRRLTREEKTEVGKLIMSKIKNEINSIK